MRTIAEVESNIDKTEPCWRWLRAHTTDGRPEVWFEGRMWYVYRLLYTHHVGPIPEKMTLDHLECDNGWCCNPEHCVPATNSANVQRALAVRYAGRTTCPSGHPKSIYGRIWRTGSNGRKTMYCSECNRQPRPGKKSQ